MEMLEDKSITENLDKYLLNKHNVLITKSIIEKMLKKRHVEYKVNDINIFIEAMTHKSYIKSFINNERNVKYLVQNIKTKNITIDMSCKIVKLQEKCYERLEFLGDSIIRLIVAEYLYTRYPDQDEGFLTKLKTKIENGESLSNFSKIIGLDKYMIISKHIELNGARNESEIGILGDVFEAFIGALYLDSKCDLALCKSFIVDILEDKIDIAEILFHETNFKDMLLKYFHKMKWQDPVYETTEIKEIDKSKKKIFVMSILDNNNKVVGRGEGNSKKKGEQYAAKQALDKYGELDSVSDESEIEVDSD